MPPWDLERVLELYELPFIDLIFKAHTIHRAHFKSDEVQVCTLLSIKTGTCPEDCAYCPQSAHYETNVTKEKLMNAETILKEAIQAKENGATRFCMGAAWRTPPKRAMPEMVKIIKAVKNLGLETCVTLGMLNEEEAQTLADAGLDYYNHNLDTSREFYPKIITTRTYDERLQTLENVRKAGMHVCCGGILGLGESREDRIQLLIQLANLPKAPESVPINRLMAIKGTPLENQQPIDHFEFIRTIAIARIMMPTSFVRLSAGRDTMSDEMHAFCFMAGANSIFSGDKLLTTPNPDQVTDSNLFAKLGLKIKKTNESAHASL